MNAMGYVKSLTILFISGALMLGFNNCSQVAFQEATGGTVSKIGGEVVDTNEIDGIEITEENVDEYEEIVQDLADDSDANEDSEGDGREPGSDDGDGSEGSSSDGEESSDDSSEDSSSEDVATDDGESEDSDGGSESSDDGKSCPMKEKFAEIKNKRDRETSQSVDDDTDYASYECKNTADEGVSNKGQKKSVICHITPSGVKLEKCLPVGAVRAQLRIPLQNSRHTVYSGPCQDEE